MSKYKKIFICNSILSKENENFTELFKKVCDNDGVLIEELDTRDCIIYAEPSQVEVFANNKLLDFSNSYIFIKKKIIDSYRTYLLTKIFDHEKVDFLNPGNREHHNNSNKITMMVTLALGGIGVPKSIICDQNSYQKNKETVLEKISFPCVVKFTGSKGQKVWSIKDEKELDKKISELTDNPDDLALIQEHVENDHDIRVFVFGDEVITAIKRTSADGFYNNLSQGGKGEEVELTDEEKKLCVKASRLSGLTLSGVDLVRLKDGGHIIFEVNKNPQMEMFEEYTDIPIRETVIKKTIEGEV